MFTKQSKQRSFPRLVCSCLGGGGGGSGGSGERGGGIKDGEGDDGSLILDLSHTRLHTVPPQVYTPASAQSLQEIHLDGNYIQELPKELCALPLLRVLSVADNDLASLPPAIGGLAGLRRIDASRNELRDIPDNIRSCRQLSVVNVSNNTLSRLPDGLTQLVSLTELYLSDVLLEFLPASLGRLCKLRVLELRDNHLNSLPKAMHRLSQLRRLDLGCNDFSHVPPVLQQLTSLQELLMDGNSLLILPAMLGHLAALSYLDVSENRLCTVATEIERCQDLQDLLLSSNQLPCLPASLGGLKKLKTLKVDGNKLTELPGTIGGLLLLEEFDCSYNELVTLPRTIGHLHHMHTLLADFNSLTHLPPEVGSCRAVRVVSLASNQLAWLPSEMSSLQRLRVLNLAHNRLRALPLSFMRLRSLSALWLSDNQSKPLVPLQNDVDLETGMRVLSNYMLPQPDTQTYDDEEDEEDEEGEEPGEEGTLERAVTDPVSGDGTERGSHRVAFLCDSSVDSVDVMEEPGNKDGARSPLCKVFKLKADEEEEEENDDDGDDEEDTFQDEDGYSEHDDEADEEEEEEDDDSMEMRMAELLPPISDRPLVMPTLISLDSALESGVEDPSFGGQSDAGHADASTTTLPWLLGYDCLLVQEEEDGDNNGGGADAVLGPGGLAADGSSRVPETGDRTSGVTVDESPCVLNAIVSPLVVSQSGPPSRPVAHSLQPSGIRDDSPPSGVHDDSSPSGIHDDSSPSGIRDDSPPSGVHDDSSPSGIRDDSPPSGVHDDSSLSGIRDDSSPNSIFDDSPSSILDNRPPSSIRDDSPTSGIHDDSSPSDIRDDSPPSVVRECSSQASSGGGSDNDEVAEANFPDRPPEPEGAARAGVLRGVAKAEVLHAGGAAVAALVVVVHSEPPRAVRVEPWQVKVIKRNTDGRRGDTDKEQEDERQENIVEQGAADRRTPTHTDSGVTLPGPSQESSTSLQESATARKEWPSSLRGPSTPSHRSTPSPPLRRAPVSVERDEIPIPVAGDGAASPAECGSASVLEPYATSTPARRPGTAFAPGRRETAMRREATPPPLPPKRMNAQQDGSVTARGAVHGQPHRLCCEHWEHPVPLARPGPPTWHANRRLHKADTACLTRTDCGLATRHALNVDTAGAAAAHAQIAPQYGLQEAHWHDRPDRHHDHYDQRDRQRVVHHPPHGPHRAGAAGQVHASRDDPCPGVGVPPAAVAHHHHQLLHTAERMQLAASRANYCDTVIAGACHGRHSPDGARANYAVPRPPAELSAPWRAAPAAAAPPACPSHRPYGPPTEPCASPHLHRREEMRPEPVAEQISPPWPRHDWHRPDTRQCPPHAQPQPQQQPQPPGREAARTMPRQPSREQLIDFILQRITQPPPPAPPPLSQPQSHTALELGETSHAQELCVVLVKRPGLGFSIVGDAGTQTRSQTGIFVHRVQPGGPAEEVLKPGDEILKANGIPLQGFTQAEAVALLKSLPSSVQLFVTRHVA